MVWKPGESGNPGGRPPAEKRFKEHQSGNPGGRPKGLARRIRRLTRDGKVLVELADKILRGEQIGGETPTLADRRWALEWFAAHGFGRLGPAEEGEARPPVTVVVLTGDPPRRMGRPDPLPLPAGQPPADESEAPLP